MTRGRSLSLLASIVAMTLTIAIALSIPSAANAHPFGGPCVRITMVSADAGYKLHLVNENSTKIGLNNRQVGSSIVLKAPEKIGILIDHTGDVKWEHEHGSNGLIGFEDHVDNDFNDAVIRVEPISCPSSNSSPAPTLTPTATALEVSFDVAAYTVNEGSSVTVTVNVLPDADRPLEIPVSVTDGTADSDDYSMTGLTDGKLSLASGVGSASFKIEAAEDSDSGTESLDLSFGELPEGVSEGTQSTAQVKINDATPPPRSNTRSDSGGGGSYKILVQQTNQPPVFTEGANTQRSVAEDAAKETNLGSPVSAIDPDGDILTYTLEGPDANSFSLNFATGQLATAVVLDYETKVAHHLIMKVYDARGGTDTIVVTVKVTGAAEQPATIQAPVLTAEQPATIQAPVLTPEPQPVETLAPEPTKTPTPTPSATPVQSATPKPTVARWLLQLQWPSSTSKIIPSPTATPEPTQTEDPTATPDLPGDSQSAMLTQFQAGGPMGDFQHTNVRSSVPLLPEKDRHLRIWPIILIAIGTAMMVVSLGKLLTVGKEKVKFGNRDFILNS